MNHQPSGLHLAAGFTIPRDFVTQTCGIVAKRGVGKTHTAVVLTEELLTIGAQVVVVDPLGVWWGLRSSIDGKGKGFSVVVFGGDHGDLPLTEDMGAQLADAIVENRLSAVVDLSELTGAATRRFMTAFAERLYHAKGTQEHRTPLHLVLDEADVFAPQRVQPDEARMLGAINAIVRRGRVRGFGVTMISQRPAVISKDVFTQIEVLIALQLVSPQDRKAVDEWARGNATAEDADRFLASLASLGRGEAWVWSPSWLKVFKKVQIRQRATFDSSRTPTAGEQPIAPPRELARVDLERLQDSMKAALEKVRANDPELLKKRIAELERELKAKPKAEPSGIRADYVETMLREQIEGRDKAWMQLTAHGLEVFRLALKLPPVAVPPAVQRAIAVDRGAPSQPASFTLKTTGRTPVVSRATSVSSGIAGDAALGKGERAILTALAQSGRACSRNYVALRAGYSMNGGSFQTYLSRLRTAAYMEGRSDDLVITDSGLAALGKYRPLPTGQALIDYWLSNLGKGERSILQAVTEAHPRVLSRDELGAATGYEPTGGSFQTYLSRLRTLGLIEGRGEVKASAELMGDA